MPSDATSHENIRGVAADSSGASAASVAGAKRRPIRFKAAFQRWIILIHRWLGVIACVFFAMWFVTGIILAYVSFPAMSLGDRLDVLSPIEAEAVNVAPGRAVANAGLNEFPQNLRLEMSADEPVYRITDWQGAHHTVSAETGGVINGVSAARALDVVRMQTESPDATIRKANLQSDQWTVTGYWNKERPFHLIDVNDAQRTQYYVSVATGEIVLDTKRSERLWNYVGAVPHWMYFEFVRHDTAVWAWVIYIIAGAGIFVALSGIWVGIDRLRLRSKYADGSVTPFRNLMKWHHLLGLFGGVFLSLWIISGFWTMYPGGALETRDITKSEYAGYAGSEAVDFKLGSAATIADEMGARRITFRRIGGEPVAVLEDGEAPASVLRLGSGQIAPLTIAEIATAARNIMPAHSVQKTEFLAEGDEYWHSGFYPKKTPIIRVRYDDAQGSWFHIDPDSGEILGLVNNTSRIDRWTIVAIHDLDLKWLLEKRPWWDFFLFFTTLPGLALSATALVIAWRRLGRTGLVPVTAGGVAEKSPSGVAAETPAPASNSDILIAYATQTGSARLLAEQTAKSLEAGGESARIRDLAKLTPAMIAAYQRAFFIISTSGDGDPPDTVMGFERRFMRTPADFSKLEYAVLALGGMGHSAYCKFGMEMDAWLAGSGARRLFDPICVDEMEEASVSAWATNISPKSREPGEFKMERHPFEPWRLVARQRLNEGGQGNAIYHMEFEPVHNLPNWQAGDIAQLAIGEMWTNPEDAENLVEREYSISSLPSDRSIHLLVREMYHPDGRKGVGSSWLIDAMKPGDTMPFRIRNNAGFRAPSRENRLILIGNGTGLAGLRSHLKHRAAHGGAPAWLIFGERNRAYDHFYAEELDKWIKTGVLAEVDLVYSRDQVEKRYVQHRIQEVADRIRSWVSDGAVIMVCGSAEGMAQDVHMALMEILGEEIFDQLAEEGRYRRDVY